MTGMEKVSLSDSFSNLSCCGGVQKCQLNSKISFIPKPKSSDIEKRGNGVFFIQDDLSLYFFQLDLREQMKIPKEQ